MEQDRPLSQAPQQLTTSALIAALHGVFKNDYGKALRVDSETTVLLGQQVPPEYLEMVWQHAYRRAEDEMVFVMPADKSALSVFAATVLQFPGIDSGIGQAITALMPFLTAMTPENLNERFHNGLSVSISLNSEGHVVSCRLALAEQPLATLEPLINLSKQKDHRAFDVFYHMLYSQEDRKELLSLKADPSLYNLLSPSASYSLPDWVVFSEDRAVAKDWWDAMHQTLPAEFCRDVLTTLSGILLMGNNDRGDQADGAGLVGLDPRLSSQYPPKELISATYVTLVSSVLAKLNKYLASFDLQENRVGPQAENANDISSVVTIVEGAPHHRTDLLKSVFDNTVGLNAEMAANGIELPKSPRNISKQLQKLASEYIPSQLTVISDLSTIMDTSVTWPRAASMPTDYAPCDVQRLIPSNRIWALIPFATEGTASGMASEAWSSPIVSSQLRELFIAEWAAKRGPVDYTADFGIGDFINWFRAIFPEGNAGFQLAPWAQERGYGLTDFFLGRHRIYISEDVWRGLEQERQAAEGTYGGYASYTPQMSNAPFSPQPGFPMQSAYALHGGGQPFVHGKRPDLNPVATTFAARSLAGQEASPPAVGSQIPLHNYYDSEGHIRQVDAEIGSERYYPEEDSDYDEREFLAEYKDPEKAQHIEVYKQTTGRKLWVAFVWMTTFWIPSPVLWLFRMKRSDVRLAWREKLVIFALIFLLNAAIIFYMIFLGHFICPDYDKVWNHKQLRTHQGTNDFYVGIHGHVYDITKFYKLQHSDNGIKTTSDNMLPMAGLDLSDYFPPPLTVACPSLVSDTSVTLQYNQTASPYSIAMHSSGGYSVASKTTALHNYTWYNSNFQPGIQKYFKGDLVETQKEISKITASDSSRYLFVLNKKIYDVTNYFLTTSRFPEADSSYYAKYSFFPSQAESLFSNFQGQDLTERWKGLDEATQKQTLECLDNAFYYGKIDFRQSARCQAANVILLVIAGILTSITVIKFVTSLRLGTKPFPAQQDSFVICQIPAYTESRDELLLAIDSLTSLNYEHKQLLLVVVCDGNIVGAGNDQTTPQIVLDIFGVDDRVDPPLRAYHALGEGSRELNYAQVYSGLYRHNGLEVPYLCIVKRGTEREQSKPGNRGKRDSQVILMNFLNHVHKQSEMSPLELEMFHHINNIIGVDPEVYEYLFTVDADTKVMPDSLTRLVAACAHDNKIAAVCGETGIQNEQQSLSTMVQVYEYFISHHLTKAFESLFGSVTCLPGCFSLYRLRTSQRFKPLIISDEIIKEYSVRHVDTLHKKNLFSLGEDRYLTTLMAKHFPRMTYRFIADAKCKTRVPSDFSVLLSQRRRWINSTVHNLVELLRLDTMCGFFLFSMRGVVFVDLLGTLMLPSVVIYLVYLIYVIASHASPLPIISIVLIAAVYGLQALVYILHRRWQHIFWMLIYIAAYPFHSFLLPIYSFWHMDDFGWGNTRIVVDESKGRKVVRQDDDETFDPRSVPYESWSTYATREGLPGAQRRIVYDERRGRMVQNVFADPPMYSSAMSVADSRAPAPSVFSRANNAVQSLPDSAFDKGTLAQIRQTVKELLATADMDLLTTQLRDKVGDMLDMEFTGERAMAVDQIIDEELDSLEDEDDGFEAPMPHTDNGPFEAMPDRREF